MKSVYIIRHADKNKETGELTDEGRRRASALKSKLGKFDIVITSDRPRTVETARLLSEQDPKIDARAGFVYNSKEEEENLRTQAKNHPLNHAGAIFENLPEFKKLATIIGQNLIDLLRDALDFLPENGKALIVSQDAAMVAAEKLLTNKPFAKQEKYFAPLEGYVVDEHMKILPLFI